jgi:PAS domain S-box-containing protein
MAGLFSIVWGQQRRVDTILTVTEARIDANHDFIPDRIGQQITVGGRANVYSGVLHTDRFVVFLQDDKSGIELYNAEFNTPIAEGDSVIATGSLEQFEGLTRLNRFTYRTIVVARPMPPPIPQTIVSANSEKNEGRVIQVFGEITRKWEDAYGSYLSIREHQNDKDSIIVFLLFRHQPGIDFNKFDVGDRLNVTGILGQFARGGALNTGYEIFPRYVTDIELIEGTGRSYLMALYIIVGVLAVVLLWVWLLRRQVARQTRALRDSENRFRSIFEGTNDAIVVLRNDLKIENVNNAACQFFGVPREQLLSKPLTDIFPSEEILAFKSQSETEREKSAIEFDMTMDTVNKNIHMLAKMNVFHVAGEQRVVLVLRDITERKQAEKEREELIEKLTDALAEVRTLSGLLPICSSCKKIRDDKGYWKQIEEYFYSHSDVRFSHGLCPDCMAKFYPQFLNKEAPGEERKKQE